MQLEARKIAEKEFHDSLRTMDGDSGVTETRWSPELEKTIKSNPLWANMKYYAIERKSRDLVLGWFQKLCPGKVVLDYCCGNGADGIYIAQAGAKQVTGIDISDISIENCKKLAQREGVTNADYRVADAENTGFADNTFDVITEYGSLHHLDLDHAIPEIARILKPDGVVICNEVLAHNPVIHAYRRLTPKMRTVWEVDHILRRKHFKIMNKYFAKVDMHFFHLMTLFAVPFRNTPVFNPILKTMEALDSVLLKIPGIKWLAWQVVFTMSEPRKELLEKKG